MEMRTMELKILEKFVDLGRQLAETRELEPLLERAMDMALDFMCAEYGYLVLVDNQGALDIRVCCNKNGKTLEKPEKQISHTILQKVITSGEALRIADAFSSIDSESVADLQLCSVLCVPLISRGRILGAIYIENRSEIDLFQEDDLNLLEYFAALAAVAIENAILNDELETQVTARTAELAHANDLLRKEIEVRIQAEKKLHELAITDSLTGLYNRRHFFELAEQELTRAQRYQRTFSIILMDLDNLKSINDQHGHLMGDRAMKIVAKCIHENSRGVDNVGRYGGDEIIILVPETPVPYAKQLAERLCQVIATQAEVLDKLDFKLTVSLGIASFGGEKDITIDQLVDQADQALYKAKRAGGNQIAIWEQVKKEL
jgi:diguanylate cyclase (GGDEF)-like protein